MSEKREAGTGQHDDSTQDSRRAAMDNVLRVAAGGDVKNRAPDRFCGACGAALVQQLFPPRWTCSGCGTQFENRASEAKEDWPPRFCRAYGDPSNGFEHPPCLDQEACEPVAAPGEPYGPVWKAGDRVCFASRLEWMTTSPAQVFVVSRFTPGPENPMVELEGQPGVFGAHIFVAAPISLPPIELEPREVGQSGTARRLPSARDLDLAVEEQAIANRTSGAKKEWAAPMLEKIGVLFSPAECQALLALFDNVNTQAYPLAVYVENPEEREALAKLRATAGE